MAQAIHKPASAKGPKLTIRFHSRAQVRAIKSAAEEAGQSLNTWLMRTVLRQVESGHTITKMKEEN